GLTAAAAGVAEGDVMLALDGEALSTPQQLIAAGESHRAGAPVALTVERNGARLDLRAAAVGRPGETYAGAAVEYGAVEFRGGQLRSLFVKPDGWRDGPVLYLMQGHPCSTVETPPTDPYGALISALIPRGIAVYRVEKPGVGDSRGGPRCQDGDFDQELAAFEAGWRDLTVTRGVGADRLFLFGHSMGGADAPLMAAAHQDAPPRGVAVYGTLMRNVHDYFLDLMRLQPFLMTGEDPVDHARAMERSRGHLRRLLLEGVDPGVIAAEGAEAATFLREGMGWDGAGAVAGHPVEYWRDLARTDFTAAWRDTRSRVLVMYGESDIVALNDEDSITIAQIVNHYRPGTAEYVEVAGADHLMSVAPPRAEAIGDAAANAPMMGAAPPRPFNPEIATRLAGWIEASLAGPAAAPAGGRAWFTDGADRLPPAEGSARNGMAVVAADLDGDGDPDLVVPQEFLPNKLLFNDGEGRFTDGSSRLPPLNPQEVPPPGPPAHDSEDVAIADFDGDGRPDMIFVSEDDFARMNRSPAHEYYRGLAGGAFERVLGRVPDTSADGVATADVNGDRRPDLLLVGEGQDRLLINDGAGGFRDETEARLPREAITAQDSRFVDVDGDRDLDLVVGYEGGHALWINTGGGVFRDETEARLPASGNVEARKVAFGDVDGDGDVDLYFAHVGWQGRAPQDALYLNDGRGRFSDATATNIPAESDTTLSAALADLDGDGDLDLATVGQRLRVFANDGRGRFTDVTGTAVPRPIIGPHVGLHAGDLNGDGRTDLYGSMLSRVPGGQAARDWMLLGAGSPVRR
ncbi:MAG TPA: FG-GAP-like repeat-containing protein, partial [Caulobacteraceae bacterium]